MHDTSLLTCFVADLIGPQVYGTSSVDAYSRVLLEGARCVEIDVWDGPDGEPIITHGYAYCSDILLVDAVKAIGDFAFAASDLPVIISLENHTHAPQQIRMAAILRAELGDKLLQEPLPDFGLEGSPNLPPPGKLRNKILLKWKNPKKGDTDDDLKTLGNTVYIGVLEVHGLRHHFRPCLTHFSALHWPPHAVRQAVLGGHVERTLIGACDPTLRPIHVFRLPTRTCLVRAHRAIRPSTGAAACTRTPSRC